MGNRLSDEKGTGYMKDAEHDPSVFQEPQMRKGGFAADASEEAARAKIDSEQAAEASEDARVEHTVWDEPGLSPELAGEMPEGDVDYYHWLQRRRIQTSQATCWWVTLGVILLSGPWALLGAFLSGYFGLDQGDTLTVALVVFGPVTEEMMKIAVALYVIEKRPFLFKSPVQIFVGVLAGALVFAGVENLLYIHVYIPEPSAELIQWRWTVCVALHVCCSFIAAIGLVRIWRGTWERFRRPELSRAFPYILVAVIVHGVYNAFAVGLSSTRYHF